MSEEFLAYLGPSDLHDGTILDVERRAGEARVLVRGASGREYVVRFAGVTGLEAHRPEGMLLYALVELRSAGPKRRFAFGNWDEADDARLEVEAREVHVEPAAPAR